MTALVEKTYDDEKVGHNKTRVKMYQTNVKENQKRRAHGNNRPHPDRAGRNYCVPIILIPKNPFHSPATRMNADYSNCLKC